jgi:poly(3-hydroxybutyrate) depolymerase
MWRAPVLLAVLLVGAETPAATAQELPRGTVIDEVKCLGDATQGYALYLPSAYTPDRAWSVLMAFHPSARGRAMVDKYRAAAEQYDYIVAGSNTSRNGPWSVSAAAVQAMSSDLGRRFSIDAERIYLTGMSGGARVAMQVALGSNTIAGVIASSAGFPDSQPRRSVPFAVYGTAGTDDFNYVEMRMLDRALTSPHRLAIFSGGHTLPTDAVAVEAIEWMELQAVKSGRRSRDDELLDRLITRRRQSIDLSNTPANTVRLLDWLVADFEGLRDVSPEAARVAALSKQVDVKKALARERSDDDAEVRMLSEILDWEGQLANPDTRFSAFGRLKGRLSQWARQAESATESPERSRARRLLGAIVSGAGGRVSDAEYRKLIEQYRRVP